VCAVSRPVGRRSADSILAAAGKGADRCAAHFHVGEWRLLRQDRAAAVSALEVVAETCPKDSVEYRIVVAELRRLGR